MAFDEQRAGDLLRDARQTAGLSLRAAAQRAATSHATLAAYESGRKAPTLPTLLRVLRAYGFETDIAVSTRIRERDGIPRGEELAQVLALAEQFPSSPHGELTFPRFGAR